MNIPRPESRQPLPLDAKKVFEGVIFDVYQWEQEMFDGSKQTFEKLKREDSVTVIPVTVGGQIIVAEQEQPGKKPFIGMFGGALDVGEGVVEGAERELYEESGCVADHYVPWFAYQPSSKIDWVVYVLIAKKCRTMGEIEPDPGEKIRLKFVGFEELVDIACAEDFRDIEVGMRILRAYKNGTIGELKKFFLE